MNLPLRSECRYLPRRSGKKLGVSVPNENREYQRDESDQILKGIEEEIFKEIKLDYAVAIFQGSTILPFKTPQYTCFYCNNTFPDMNDLAIHTATVHGIPNADEIKKAVLSHNKSTFEPILVNVINLECRICDDIVRDDLYDLEEHLSKTHDVDIPETEEPVLIPFKISNGICSCVLCDKDYENFNMLTCHMNEHFPNYKCGIRNDGFLRQDPLSIHNRIDCPGIYDVSLFDIGGREDKDVLIKTTAVTGVVSLVKNSAEKSVKSVVKAPPEIKRNKLRTVTPIKIKTVQLPPKKADFSTIDITNIFMLIKNSKVLPFKIMLNKYFRCFYCEKEFKFIDELQDHNDEQHEKPNGEILKRLLRDYKRRSQPVKINVANVDCRLCDDVIKDFTDLKRHLHFKHCKKIYLNDDEIVTPYKLKRDDFECVICEQKFFDYPSINKHMSVHPKNTEFFLDNLEKEQRIPKPKKPGFKTSDESCSFNNAFLLIKNSKILPFQIKDNVFFRCCYCEKHFKFIDELQIHRDEEHEIADDGIILRLVKYYKYRSKGVKVNVVNVNCRLCDDVIKDFADLRQHLRNKHGENIDLENDDMLEPFKIGREFSECVVCEQIFLDYFSLCKHMNVHSKKPENGLEEHALQNHDVAIPKTNPLISIEVSSFNNAFVLIKNSKILPFKVLQNKFFRCVYCEDPFSLLDELQFHVNEKHENPSDEEIRRILKENRTRQGMKVNVANVDCRLCDEVISDLASLRRHLRNKHGENIDLNSEDMVLPFKVTTTTCECVICGEKEFFDCFALTSHMFNVHFQKPPENPKMKKNKETKIIYPVSCMSEKMKANNNALILITKSNIVPFKYTSGFRCFYCAENFGFIDELEEHTNVEHIPEENVVRSILSRRSSDRLINLNVAHVGCRLCRDHIKDYVDLKEHLRHKHGENILESDGRMVPFKMTRESCECVYCGETFSSCYVLSRHMNVHYRNYICDECGSGFLSELRLKKHIQTHTKLRSNNCDLCSKTFKTRNAMKNHRKTVHKRLKTAKCPYCPESFRFYDKRQKHILEVHNVKVETYECSFCDAVFWLKTKWSTHERIAHHRDKPHKCTECEMKFSYKKALNAHVMTVHRGETYDCSLCLKSYTSMKYLRSHTKTAHPGCKFKCEKCDKVFVVKISLDGHMERSH